MQLGFDFDAPRLVRVTPSKLDVWDGCRRRFRMTYLDRPSPPRGGAWAGATLGAVVHLALRALFELPRERRTPERGAALVDANWSSEGFRDRAQADEYRERARGWVADYVEGLPADLDIAASEKWVSVSTDRIVAEGRADRIDRRGDELVVVDYKTGRPSTDRDAASSRALAIYAVAAERTLHRPCAQVELHHLPTGHVAVHRHDPGSLRAHVAAAEATAGAFDAATEGLAAGGDPEVLFPPDPGPRCGSCDMRRNCPEGRAAAPELQPWALLAP